MVACIHSNSWTFAHIVVEEHWKMRMEEKPKPIFHQTVIALVEFCRDTEWAAGSLVVKLSSLVRTVLHTF